MQWRVLVLRLTPLLPAALLLTLSACDDAPIQLDRRHRACIDSDTGADDLSDAAAHNQLAFLEEAFDEGSQTQLTEFIETWAFVIHATDCDEFDDLSAEVQEAHLLYHDYFDPFDLTKYHGFGGLGSGREYLVAPGSMSVKVEGGDWVEYEDFRPALDIPETTVLYLTPRYRQILQTFLDEDLEWEEVYDRYEFLERQLPIRSGHWGGWHLLTYPSVYGIYFDADLTEGWASFRIGFEGGYSILVRDWWSWLLAETHYTWIE